MKKIILGLLFLSSQLVFAGWVDMNTGINDDLTGVVFWGNNGMVSGRRGLYYTTTGGIGPASWSRFNITGNLSDSLIYNHTQFYHAYSNQGLGGTNMVFACGEDTVTGKAIIISVNFPSLSYQIIYIGPLNSSLKRIEYYPTGNCYYSVGDDGLIIRFTTSTANLISFPYTNDLKSISFNSNNYILETDGYNIYGSISGMTLTSNSIVTPGYNYSAGFCEGYNSGYRVGNSFYYNSGGPMSEITYYDFGPLNANCIISKSSNFFVGTDHGVFRSTSTHSFLEYQTSSGFASISSFWFETLNPNNFYACGTNGKLLLSTDEGGTTKPIAFLNPLSTIPGACVGSFLGFFSSTVGSSTSCQWLMNGVSMGSLCTGFTHTFNTLGSYNIQLCVSNALGSYDTADYVIQIVDPPEINKPCNITDTILCHSEPLQILIDSSQLNVVYVLKKAGDLGSYGVSTPGNGSTLIFNTDFINSTGNYYLQAQSTFANCSSNFTDTFSIVVEQTDARFHSGYINVIPGEDVRFYNNCVDAQNFLWNFSSAPGITSSSLPLLDNSFGSVGATVVKLVCWSNNGCYDSIIAPGPMVYTDPVADDSCWTMVNLAEEVSLFGADIRQMSPTFDGFFTVGHYNHPEVFYSRYGNSNSIPGVTGGYLQKTDLNGVIKWMIYTRKLNPPLLYTEVFDDVVEDANRNIYICGDASCYLTDNTGDSVLLGDMGTNNGFIVKVDSMGKIVWRLTAFNSTPHDMQIDHSGNLIVMGKYGSPTLYLNGIGVDTLESHFFSDKFVAKISPDGEVLWDFEIGYYAPSTYYGEEIPDIEVDGQNNFYITGYTQSPVTFYSANSSIPNTVGLVSDAGLRMFLVKYDSLGQLIWTTRAFTSLPTIDGTQPHSMVTDVEGNCYITGGSWCYDPSTSMVFENSNGSTVSKSTGRYFVAKVNSNGFCNWIQGADYSYYGDGYEIIYNEPEVSVLGRISNNTNTTELATLTSTNGIGQYVSMESSDLFLAIYDTSGNLLRVALSNTNSEALIYNDFSGLFKRPDGSYYYSSHVGLASMQPPTDCFGSYIDSTNYFDGSITKFYESCGIVENPCATYSSISVTDCNPFTLNGITYTLPGLYQQIFPNSLSCDSVVTIHIVSLYEVIIAVDQFGNTLSASSNIASSYQWINCSGNIIIPGATNQSFTPSSAGSYAAIIYENGCIDTTECFFVNPANSIDEENVIYQVGIFPNPTEGKATIFSDIYLEDASLVLMDTYGHIVLNISNINGSQYPLDINGLAKGVYFAEISSNMGKHVLKLIRQ
jgi:hypothetical protein